MSNFEYLASGPQIKCAPANFAQAQALPARTDLAPQQDSYWSLEYPPACIGWSILRCWIQCTAIRNGVCLKQSVKVVDYFVVSVVFGLFGCQWWGKSHALINRREHTCAWCIISSLEFRSKSFACVARQDAFKFSCSLVDSTWDQSFCQGISAGSNCPCICHGLELFACVWHHLPTFTDSVKSNISQI